MSVTRRPTIGSASRAVAVRSPAEAGGVPGRRGRFPSCRAVGRRDLLQDRRPGGRPRRRAGVAGRDAGVRGEGLESAVGGMDQHRARLPDAQADGAAPAEGGRGP
ncbi:hypothetical protein GCM10020295_59010 [Streptomyces cinereospinus]